MRLELETNINRTRTGDSTTRIVIKMDRELKRAFHLACVRNGQSISEVIRTLVESYLISERELRESLTFSQENESD